MARLAAIIALSNGAEGIEIPDVDELVEKFNTALAAAPEMITAEDRDRHMLMVALELRDA